MEDTITIQRIGGALGAVFSAEMLRRLDVAEGDLLFVEEAGGGFLLTPRDPAYERVMEEYRRRADGDAGPTHVAVKTRSG